MQKCKRFLGQMDYRQEGRDLWEILEVYLRGVFFARLSRVNNNGC